MFEVQAKLRAGQPAYLKRWLREICASANKRERIGIVVWKEPGTAGGRGSSDDNALVVMRFKDFVDLHGEVYGQDAGMRETLP